jgi:ER lumen protein retaining receptor
MNIFRLTGDLAHLTAIFILLLKIWKTRSCSGERGHGEVGGVGRRYGLRRVSSLSGISGKSQVLFALTYTTRYLDLLTNFVSLYNTTMKVVFIGASLLTLYLIYFKFKATYDSNHDTFR